MPLATQGNMPTSQGMDPQLVQDMEQMAELQAQIDADRKRIQALAAALSSMANPLYGMQVLMNELMGVQGDTVSGLSATDNLDSDLRSDITAAQTSWNNMIGVDSSGKPKVVSQQDLDHFLSQIHQIENFIHYQYHLSESSSGNPLMDMGTIQTFLNTLDSMPYEGPDGKDVSVATVQSWNNKAQPSASGSGGTNSPEIQQMQNGMQTFNQLVSSMSTSTNTNLQFQTEQYKQLLGIDQDLNQSTIQYLKQLVNNQQVRG